MYKQKLLVQASHIDCSVKLGVVGATIYMQDNMCNYFKQLGCDGITMIPVCQSFFVITKTKIKFHSDLNWLDEVGVETSVFDKSKIRVNLNNCMYFSDGKIAVEGIQELCPIDSKSRKLRSVESTLFPCDVEVSNKVGDLEYSKFNFDKNDFELKKSIAINLSNVDYYMHTNNVEYVRFCLSVLDEKVFENKCVDTFEIHYIKESRIGQVLDIFVRQNDDKIDYLFMTNEDIVVKTCLTLKDK